MSYHLNRLHDYECSLKRKIVSHSTSIRLCGPNERVNPCRVNI